MRILNITDPEVYYYTKRSLLNLNQNIYQLMNLKISATYELKISDLELRKIINAYPWNFWLFHALQVKLIRINGKVQWSGIRKQQTL